MNAEEEPAVIGGDALTVRNAVKLTEAGGGLCCPGGRTLLNSKCEGNIDMTLALWLIVACGVLSIVYGVVTTRTVMAADAGSARMQEISNAVREGATAYLKRQYTTIAIVGVGHPHARLAASGHLRRHRLSDRRRALGRCRLYRHECLGARQCPRRPGGARPRLPAGSISPSNPAR